MASGEFFHAIVFLEETIRSVLLQGYPDLDHFVKDGGSTDGSVEIIQKYAPWLAGWVSEENKGLSGAINKGFGFLCGPAKFFSRAIAREK